MTAATGTEHGIGNLVAQGSALAGRNLRQRANAEMLVVFGVFPVIFVFGFLLLFGRLFAERGLDYAQFLPPAIVAQWMFTVANTSGAASAADRASGMLTRCLSMPVNRAAVVVGRLASDAVWAVLAVVVISATGYVAGFRFQGGALAVLGFVLLAVAFALTLTAATTAVGLSSTDPEAVAATLNLPYLALIMLSTAFVPADAFPGWLEPVIRYSPVSVVIEALRSLASATPSWGQIWPAVAWLAGLLVIFSWAAARAFRRAR
ncbi:ABC transporter permease [Verrucosispora sp. WMMC514]|uniref:ABC transporter permease n=1 Tax=Verrucosispora sp. WMMC514 TaxID=3015156 RepID=UPI00248BD6F5|nr:ABC transporter permease [Verrucosispora sp. WMMC514]WBB94077.1 ABC transporter permease [Verrucosispora sp. WMMC514]